MKSTCCGVRLRRTTPYGATVHEWVCRTCGATYRQGVRTPGPARSPSRVIRLSTTTLARLEATRDQDETLQDTVDRLLDLFYYGIE